MSVIDIRNSAVSILKDAGIASGRIFNSKISPVQIQNTPDIRVFTDSVQATNLATAKPAFISTVNLQIDIVVTLTSTWADDADQLVVSVIDTLMSNAEWVAKFTEIENYQVAYSFFGDGVSPLAIASINVIGKVFKAY